MIDPQPDEVAEGKLVLGHQPSALHLNHNGDVNAAVLFSLAEMAGVGVVVTTLGPDAAHAYVVIKSGAVDFTAPARGRIQAVATLNAAQCARVRAFGLEGSIEEVVAVLIRDVSGRGIANCEGTAVIRRRRRD